MKKLLIAAACAATLCAAGVAQAGVLTFNDPGVIDIDNNTGVATYTESGFTISGQAASFLPIDSALVGGFDGTPFSLKALGGGPFSLLSLDYAPYFFDPDALGTLSVVGLFDGLQVASEDFVMDLDSVTSFVFDNQWLNLTEVTFTGTNLFSLDNINAAAVAVPEPGTLALTALALMGVVAARKRKTVG